MPWLVWRAVRKNAMAPRGSTDCTTWLKLVDEIRKTPLHEAPLMFWHTSAALRSQRYKFSSGEKRNSFGINYLPRSTQLLRKETREPYFMINSWRLAQQTKLPLSSYWTIFVLFSLFPSAVADLCCIKTTDQQNKTVCRYAPPSHVCRLGEECRSPTLCVYPISSRDYFFSELPMMVFQALRQSLFGLYLQYVSGTS